MAPPVVDISVAEFADLIGKTSQRVYQLIQKGLPHRKRKGVTRIVAKEGIRWWVEYVTWDLEEQRKKKDGKDAPDEKLERALKARIDRQMAEIDLQERSRELVPASNLTEFVERVFGTFAAVVLGRLQRYERDMVHTKTLTDARMITDRMKVSLMEGARSYADQLDDEAVAIEGEAALEKKSAAAADDEDGDEESE